MTEKIEKISLERQAAAILKRRILNGTLKQGERLVEVPLAEEFSLSRGTIRAAFQHLASEGLAEQIPYAGWSVVTLQEQDIWELTTLRQSYEGLAARLASKAIDGEGRKRLLAAFENLIDVSRTNNVEQAVEADFQLHRVIIDIAGHSRLADLYQKVEAQFTLLMHSSVIEEDTEDFGECHRPLIDAILRGDADEAERQARENVTLPNWSFV